MALKALLFIFMLTGCRATRPSQVTPTEDVPSAENADPQNPENIPLAMWSPSQRRSNASYFYLLGEMLQLRGQGSQALTFIESAYNLDPNPFLGAKFIALKGAFGERNEAILEARRMTLLYPQNAELHFIHGVLLINSDDTKRGIDALKKSIKINPRNENPYIQLAGVLQREKRDKEAIAVAKDLIKENPHSLAGWTLLSRLYLLGENRSLALEPARKAYEIQGNIPEIILIYAIALEFSNKSQDAVPLYEQLFRINPTNEQLIGRMVELYQKFGNLEDALSIIDEALRRSASPLPALAMQKAILLWELKKFDEASKILRDLANEYPESDRLQYMAALSLEREKKLDEALSRYSQIPKDSSLRIHADFRAALIFRERKQFGQAELYANAVMQTDRADQDAYLLLSGIKGDQEDYVSAIRILELGYKKFPDKHKLLFMIGVYQERLGNYQDAMNTMRQVIKLEPQNSAALNYLGYMYAERGMLLDEAEALIKKALELKQNDGYYLDSLGWVYFQKKNYPKALEVLTEALKFAPDEGIIFEHLAEVHEALGNLERARALMNEALTKELEKRDRDRIEKKLKRLKKQ